LKQGLEDLGEEFGETFVLELYEQLMEESSSSLKRVKVGSSRLGQRYIYREREGCDEQLYQDYFGEDRPSVQNGEGVVPLHCLGGLCF
jgi:hypothetical protein